MSDIYSQYLKKKAEEGAKRKALVEEELENLPETGIPFSNIDPTPIDNTEAYFENKKNRIEDAQSKMDRNEATSDDLKFLAENQIGTPKRYPNSDFGEVDNIIQDTKLMDKYNKPFNLDRPSISSNVEPLTNSENPIAPNSGSKPNVGSGDDSTTTNVSSSPKSKWEQLLEEYRNASKAREDSATDAFAAQNMIEGGANALNSILSQNAAMVGRSYQPTLQGAGKSAAEAITKKADSKLASAKTDLESEELRRTKDPNSELAQNYRTLLKSNKQLEGVDLDSMNAGELESLYSKVKEGSLTPYQVESLKLQKEGEDRRESREQRAEKEAQFNRIDKLITQDPVRKKRLDQLKEFADIETTLKGAASGNEASVAALGTKMARAMGEVGVLTDSDVTRYLGQRSWGRQFQNWIKGGAQGKLPSPVIKELSTNMNEFSANLYRDLNRGNEDIVRRVKTVYPDMKDDLIRGYIPNYGVQTQDKEQSSVSSSQQTNINEIKEWLAKQDPNDPKAIAVRKKAGL